MNFYSNASTDQSDTPESRAIDEGAVRRMYEFAPYPDLGADPKDLSLFTQPIAREIEALGEVDYLDLGCGTGHITVGVALQHPNWRCHGLDLSNASLNIARQLAVRHKVSVDFQRGSYLDPLPWDKKFDIVGAIGTIHHCASPADAMHSIRRYVKDNGFVFIHLYGLRCDRDKFDIKETLSILEPDLSNYERRFEFYRALVDHRKKNWLKRLALTTPSDVYGKLKRVWRDGLRKRRGVSWSPPFDADYDELTAPWIDHFCHPCERAYEIPEVQTLFEATGFKVLHMLKQGRERAQLIPAAWRERYDRLDDWQKWRLSELLSVGGGSFAIIAQPKPA